ncbi:MAG: HypC/HybG/HupF family hydrogenase formation chaperone [Cyclobacteriaceae bacterium]|nr:HypC/HybG/HupF family hydrogenase formation chaperone [Cyclobacteriaceae bacterium]
MCLAIPGKIESIELQYNDTVRMAKVSFGGIIKEALKTFKYLEKIGELGELEDGDDYLQKKRSKNEILSRV